MTPLEFAWRWLIDNSDALAVLVALAAALLAFLGLVVSARALRQQSRALDAGAYLDISRRLGEALRKVRADVPTAQAELHWVELLNLLEGTSALYRRGRLGRAVRTAVKGELFGALYAIDANASTRERLAKALAPAATFAALRWFLRRYQAEIARYVAALAATPPA
ncbi:MAG TPA: hypothetical protein VMC10_06940 [Stellaceae bacterium]|nr:hypothetical protein [Stellaceae bacterium]